MVLELFHSMCWDLLVERLIEILEPHTPVVTRVFPTWLDVVTSEQPSHSSRTEPLEFLQVRVSARTEDTAERE